VRYRIELERTLGNYSGEFKRGHTPPLFNIFPLSFKGEGDKGVDRVASGEVR